LGAYNRVEIALYVRNFDGMRLGLSRVVFLKIVLVKKVLKKYFFKKNVKWPHSFQKAKK